MKRELAINYEITDFQKRISSLLVEQRALFDMEEKQPQKPDKPKRKRRTKVEMERDVTSAIRYLIDEEHNGATQREAERRFRLPTRILSKGKWAERIEMFRKMR